MHVSASFRRSAVRSARPCSRRARSERAASSAPRVRRRAPRGGRRRGARRTLAARSSRRRSSAPRARPPPAAPPSGCLRSTRAMRNQVVNGNGRTVRTATSARSRTTSPNPPACRTRFIAFSARVASPVSRIHSRRDRSSPSAAADAGSKRSQVSTSATARHARPRPPSARHTTVVRPDERRRRSPRDARAAARRRAPRRATAHRCREIVGSGRASARRPARPPTAHEGEALVNVTSSFRARSSDSRCERAALVWHDFANRLMLFSLFLRL